MYPQFEIYWLPIFTFWIALSVSFVLFFWMLYKLSLKYWINTNFFLNNILFYFLSMFFVSRLFFIISDWRNSKFIFKEWFFKFIFMSDYNFSLIWGIVWFLAVLFFKIKKFKLKSEKYIDASTLAFLFAAIVWFLWAFLWWQIIWKPTDLWIWITYSNPLSRSPYSGPIFPLAVFYSIFSFLTFTWLYITRLFVKIEWFVWYLWIAIFSSLLLIFEFFNWNPDIFSSFIYLNITQIWAIWLIVYAWKWLMVIYKQEIQN